MDMLCIYGGDYVYMDVCIYSSFKGMKGVGE